MRRPASPETLEKIRVAVDWTISPEGQLAIDAGLGLASKEISRLKKDRFIHPDRLNRPCTI